MPSLGTQALYMTSKATAYVYVHYTNVYVQKFSVIVLAKNKVYIILLWRTETTLEKFKIYCFWNFFGEI